MLVKDIVSDFLYTTLLYRRPATYDSYCNTFRPVLAHFEDRDGESITVDDMERYAAERVKMGAGRCIAREISLLKSACKQKGLSPQWPLPRQLYGIPKQVRVVPSDSDMARVYDNVNGECRLAFGLALFAGLRCQEVFRVRREHVDKDGGVITIPGTIRKVAHSRRLPLVGTLSRLIVDEDGSLVKSSERDIDNELRRVSRWFECERQWRGLQVVRKALVTWVEEETCTRNSDLITGHSRNDMASHYTHQLGHLELKRKILEAVESRLARALEAYRVDHQHEQGQDE